MSDYLRAGKTIGIIGGDIIGLMLSMQAKIMGFNVCILDPNPNCPAKKISDNYIQADYNDQSAIERLNNVSDVITYSITEGLDISLLSQMINTINLPQSTDLLSLSKDRLLLKNFLENCGVNILPYSTIIQMTDIEEKIDGIGYPCVLSETHGNKCVKLTGTSDLFSVLDLVKEDTCILEASLDHFRKLSIVVAKNQKSELTIFPPVEHIYDLQGRMVETISFDGYLDHELENELVRISKIIADNVDSSGVFTIDFVIDDNGIIFVDNINSIMGVKSIYSLDSCAINVFEAHIRSICNWPLMGNNRRIQNTIIYHIIARELTMMQRQIPYHSNWKFYLYDYEANNLGEIIGHISVLSKNLKYDLQELDQLSN